jgi:hypothetical protein
MNGQPTSMNNGQSTFRRPEVPPSIDGHGSDTILVQRWATDHWEDWCRCSIGQAQRAKRTGRVPSMKASDRWRLVDWISRREVDPFLPPSVDGGLW